VPKQLALHGLAGRDLGLTDERLAWIARDYTREAGVRQLAREIAKVCRAAALDAARGKPASTTITDEDLRRVLGRPRFLDESAERTSVPGVAAGLAWTPVGGDILYIETTRMPGRGKLEVTGQLGDVMKESAAAALAYLRSHAEEIGIDPSFLEKQDLHLHVPAGAVPKDGPSAGVTIFTALASLLTGRRVRHDTAMTGEVTLRGRVLPVGGIKAKVLAAHRAGFTRVLLPVRNEVDLDDVPESVRASLDVVLVADLATVLREALEPEVGTDADGGAPSRTSNIPKQPLAA
jgi:ATP-dependent Lon protease